MGSMRQTVEGIMSAILFGMFMLSVMVLGLCYEDEIVALRMAIFGG